MLNRTFTVTLLLLISSHQLTGAPSSANQAMEGLLTNSPFGKAGANSTPTAAAAEPLEFRAVLEETQGRSFSIFERATRRSIWIDLNEAVYGISVKTFNVATESIVVAYQGKLLTLTLKRASGAVNSPTLSNGTLPFAPMGNSADEISRADDAIRARYREAGVLLNKRMQARVSSKP